MTPPQPADPKPVLVPARLTRNAEGILFSPDYGDVYHTRAGAPGQARHVFLGGNDLPRRWQRRRHFTLLETGFGAGLNFLATWAAWRDDPLRARHLHFISIERHPFAATDLATIHRDWPEFAALSAMLLAQWPTLTPGWHRLHFADGQLTLDLLFGDAAELVPQLSATVDAYFLDGFAPARNPALWSDSLLAALSGHAAPGATLATWSVAGRVCAALNDAGWRLEKVPGFSGKREMLRGDRPPMPSGAEATRTEASDAGATGADAKARSAIVIGAGLAGSSAANRLAARGWQVTLVDSADGPGEGASGNRAGVLRPLPSRDDNVLAQITRCAFLYTRRHLQALADADLSLAWSPCGTLHLARDATHEETQRRVVDTQQPPADYLRFVDREEAGARCGWPVDAGGWWFPGGAWVSPASYCRANLLPFRDLLTRCFGRRVARILHRGDRWRCVDAAGKTIADARHLIVANAADARRLLGDWLPVFPARGQVSHLPAAPGSPPKTVVCRLGYVTPEIDGERYAGATFQMRDDAPEVRLIDHRENLAKLEFILPGYTAGLDPATLAGRVGFRPASPDRLPIVGSVPMLGDAPAPPGLWLINGFGARGIVWSALAGELLAARIEGTPLPIERSLADALLPARFLARRARPKVARPPPPGGE